MAFRWDDPDGAVGLILYHYLIMDVATKLMRVYIFKTLDVVLTSNIRKLMYSDRVLHPLNNWTQVNQKPTHVTFPENTNEVLNYLNLAKFPLVPYEKTYLPTYGVIAIW